MKIGCKWTKNRIFDYKNSGIRLKNTKNYAFLRNMYRIILFSIYIFNVSYECQNCAFAASW